MRSKKDDHKKFNLNIHSLFDDTSSALTKIMDLLNPNIPVNDYWFKRVNAVAVDYFILLVTTGILWPTARIIEFMLALGVLSILYFTITESFFGYTIGKRIFSLHVTTSYRTRISLKKSFIRNTSKFNIVILVLDVIVGHFTSKTHKKYLDRITNTTVQSFATPDFRFSEVTYVETTY